MTVPTSSAESELLASVKGAADGLGIVSLGDNLGLSLNVRLQLDAAAALAILERRGVGKVRHLDVGTLRFQEKQLRKIIDMHKVPGHLNPGGLLTKHFSRDRIGCYTTMLNYKFIGGFAVGDGRRADQAG